MKCPRCAQEQGHAPDCPEALDHIDALWQDLSRGVLRIIFERAPGGAKALHTTLDKLRGRAASPTDAERMEFLIALVEASGAYAPMESPHRELYEQHHGA